MDAEDVAQIDEDEDNDNPSPCACLVGIPLNGIASNLGDDDDDDDDGDSGGAEPSEAQAYMDTLPAEDRTF